MKYYVFETEVVNSQQAFLTTLKESMEDAKMLYHQILASCYANQNLTYALVMIIDENGMPYGTEKISKPEPNPQPAEE